MAQATEEEIRLVEKVLSKTLTGLELLCTEHLSAIELPFTYEIILKMKEGWVAGVVKSENVDFSQLRYYLRNYPASVHPIVKDLADQIKANFTP